MPPLVWDEVGKRFYETGVDHGVLYKLQNGLYDEGYAWNGLTAVTESPSGAEPTPVYADNMKYLNLVSAEELSGTIEALTFPKEFASCDGTAVPTPGVSVGQQTRDTFGLSYRTRIGNDETPDLGYKLHLVYAALAAPSEKAYNTVNDTPEAMPFSWEFSTTPIPVTGLKPTSQLTIDSTEVDAEDLLVLENALYGTVGTDPRLPLPDEVIAMFSLAATAVTPTTPTFVSGTGVVTIPTVTGVTYYNGTTGVTLLPGAQAAISAGSTIVVKARPATGAYYFTPQSDDDWSFERP